MILLLIIILLEILYIPLVLSENQNTSIELNVEAGRVTTMVPKDLSIDELRNKIKEALETATKQEQSTLVKETISNIAKNNNLVTTIANKFKDIVNKGYDGCTIPIMRIRSYTEKDERIIKIVIISIMIISIDERKLQEIDRLKKHEEGHAKINEEIVKKLSPQLAKQYFKKDMSKEDINNAESKLRNSLVNIQDKAHSKYDEFTDHGRKGTASDQLKRANEVIEEVLKESSVKLRYLPLRDPEAPPLTLDEISLVLSDYWRIELRDLNFTQLIDISDDILELSKELMNGVDFNLEFGKNVVYASNKLALLALEISKSNDTLLNRYRAKRAIYYIDNILYRAETLDINISDEKQFYSEIQNSLLMEDYFNVVLHAKRLSKVLLPKLFPKYQRIEPYTLVLVGVFSEKEPIKNAEVLIINRETGELHKVYSDNRGVSITIISPGNYRYLIPIRMNILGFPLISITRDLFSWSSGVTKAPENGVLIISINIKTFITPSIIMPIIENIPNIAIALVIGIASLSIWRLRKRTQV